MPTLSLSMIVKNEEATIERVLACAKTFCDEMIVVDTGSTDRTVELAEQMGAKVFHFEWIDDFSAARNYSLAQCTMDWVIWLDADDVVTPECQQRFKELKENVLNDSINAVWIPYHYWYDAHGNCTFINRRERMFRRSVGFRWFHPVHEVVYIAGETLSPPDLWIEHRYLPGKLSSERNMRILEKAMQQDEHRNNERMVYITAKEMRHQCRHEQAVELFKRFLELNPCPIRWQKYDAYLSMGFSCKALSRRDEAKQHFKEALQTDSRRAEAFNELAFLHYESSEWDFAIPLFEAATRCKVPTTEDLVLVEHYNWLPREYLSRCYSELGNYTKAIEIALSAIPEHPDKSNIISLIGWYLGQIAMQYGVPNPKS